MFTSADVIEALRRRGRKSLRPDTPPGEFPAGWQDWFDAMVARLGAVTGAAADAFVALFLERELATPPPRAGTLTHWQAFATLWRQQWQPPPPDERRERVLAMAITLLVHLVLLALLLWIALVRFTGAPAPRGEEVVQVEFIGRGTPPGTGGAPAGRTEPAAQNPPVAATSAHAATASQRAASVPAAARPQPSTPSQQPPVPAQAAPPQPLQVSEVPSPTSEFVLPPPTPRSVDLPRLQAPELPQVEPRDVEVIEQAAPVEAPRASLPSAALAAPILQPDIAPTLPDVQARSIEVPRLSAPGLEVERRDVPLREAQPAAAPAATSAPQAVSPGTVPAQQPSAAGTAAQSAAPAAGPPAARNGTTPAAAATTGAGPASAKPGAWPSPARNDDWGNSTRNRPGGTAGKPGLFDQSGRPRLPPGMAAPGGGLPPGTVTEKIADLDRAGTWLKRPPIDYTPTRFDKFWTPNETLLEEWVRKNIRSVEIPIPGSSKKLHCIVSLLQLGGGCGIEDSNLQDQEAEARKPPDVPFKPELQDDPSSLRKP